MKIGTISIQTNEELLLFKDHLRKIIILPCLINGKASTWTPKAVLVYFEDASSEMKETLASGNSSKKVYIYIMLYFVTKYYYCRILCHLHHVKTCHPFQMVKLISKLGRWGLIVSYIQSGDVQSIQSITMYIVIQQMAMFVLHWHTVTCYSSYNSRCCCLVCLSWPAWGT